MQRGRPRKPLALHEATGAIAKNPKRFRNRREPGNLEPLGDPPLFKPEWREDWLHFQRHLWWLRKPDRMIIEAICYLKARLRERYDDKDTKELIKLLVAVGATPVSR